MRVPRFVQPRRLGMSLIVAVAAVMVPAVAANAVLIDPTTLSGPQGSVWDSEGNYTYGVDGGPCTGVDGTTQEVGFTPADDVLNDFTSDVFDGGLFLMINGDAFGDGIENSALSAGGHQLITGPQTKSGLAITRFDRALQTSPTMRTLVRFTNNGGANRTVNVVWDSAMGSDTEERTRASSSGNLRHEPFDRWIVSSDDPLTADLGDPPALFVFYGIGAPEKVNTVIFAPEDEDPENGIGEACIAVRYRITVPAHSVRYLLFFTDIARTNEAARTQAAKYNHRVLNANLTVGLSGAIKNKILNWDLV